MATLDQLGVTYLSPSAINAFISDPAYWVARYVFRAYKPLPFGPWAWAGDAVEAGVSIASYNHSASDQDILLQALSLWQRREREAAEQNDGAILFADEDMKAAGTAVPKCLQIATPVFRGFGPLNGRQVKMVWRPEWSQVDIIGYVDFVYGDRDRDLKVKSKTPKGPAENNLRQTAIYTQGRKREQSLVYVKAPGAKSEGFLHEYVVTPEIAEGPLIEVQRAVRAMQRLAKACKTRNDLLELTFPNLENWIWDEPGKIAAQALWELKEPVVWE